MADGWACPPPYEATAAPNRDFMTPAEAPGSTAPTIVILTDDQEGSAGTVLYASPVPFLVVANPHARYSWLQSQRLHTYITLRKGEEANPPQNCPRLRRQTSPFSKMTSEEAQAPRTAAERASEDPASAVAAREERAEYPSPSTSVLNGRPALTAPSPTPQQRTHAAVIISRGDRHPAEAGASPVEPSSAQDETDPKADQWAVVHRADDSEDLDEETDSMENFIQTPRVNRFEVHVDVQVQVQYAE
ncbi:hypothetical protein POSPLADRAFT_1157277 [Postia placenta MAD-698-R-SB12]|uniref:Uncharacterized protein n=1 Tax=Postia placenta MAD-698-R-SB12 TaxID=670580 RepID=A0A1X6MLB4_9APHY|nr:hypothetical protein POSPLADRAFT_1157277 [Postia placenta MAD-698-R-SB12]OSX57221.1 hypothetical protein POSPLADRAFT_1157277 [Postia placenta MAD-698-R-SB12]